MEFKNETKDSSSGGILMTKGKNFSKENNNKNYFIKESIVKEKNFLKNLQSEKINRKIKIRLRLTSVTFVKISDTL